MLDVSLIELVIVVLIWAIGFLGGGEAVAD